MDKKSEVSFLAEEFELPATKAAQVVSGNEAEIRELAAAQLRAEREKTSYEPGAKVPVSPEKHAVKGNAGLQKTVLDRGNKAGEAGP